MLFSPFFLCVLFHTKATAQKDDGFRVIGYLHFSRVHTAHHKHAYCGSDE
jgi:hypothetical protein